MRKIVDYMILYYDNEEELEKQVRSLLKDDWQPYGRSYIAYCRDTDCEFNYQTMVTYEEEKPDNSETHKKNNSLKQKFLSISEVVNITGISKTTLWRLANERKFPSGIKIGGIRKWRESDIYNFIADSKKEVKSIKIFKNQNTGKEFTEEELKDIANSEPESGVFA